MPVLFYAGFVWMKFKTREQFFDDLERLLCFDLIECLVFRVSRQILSTFVMKRFNLNYKFTRFIDTAYLYLLC